MSYNPKYGDNGRVGKNDFSIDGKSWDYRDPENFNDGGNKASSEPTYNRHSYEYTNPLYDYDYGTVRDAAAELGIGNVDEQSEVDRLIEYIQNPKTVKVEVPVETPVEDPVEEIPPEERPNPNAELSPGYAQSQELLGKNLKSIIDGTKTDALYGLEPGTTAAKMNAESTVPEESSNPFSTNSFMEDFRRGLLEKMNFGSNFPFGE